MFRFAWISIPPPTLKWPLTALVATGVLCSLLFVLTSYGQTNQGAAPAASVPDLNGHWGRLPFGYRPPYTRREGDSFFVIDGYDSPVLRPWTVQILMEKAAFASSGKILTPPEITCWPNGVPGIFNFQHIQILQTPTQIMIFYKNNNQSRRIYLNQEHSENILPSWYGESVGHFEGDTLVVDTVGFLRRPETSIDDYGTPVTEGLHVVERYRFYDDPTPPPRLFNNDTTPNVTLDYNGKIVEVTFTVEDPNTFKKPWAVTLYFRPVLTPAGVLEESICSENNREDWAVLSPIADRPDF